jgi:DNA-binding transcriptional MerR regulator
LYRGDQVTEARLVRLLRSLDLPLDQVRTAVAAWKDGDDAAVERLVGEHRRQLAAAVTRLRGALPTRPWPAPAPSPTTPPRPGTTPTRPVRRDRHRRRRRARTRPRDLETIPGQPRYWPPGRSHGSPALAVAVSASRLRLRSACSASTASSRQYRVQPRTQEPLDLGGERPVQGSVEPAAFPG